MKILSWNVNGIRSVARKGFLEWLQRERPDVLCLQEIKARPDQLPPELVSPPGYLSFWNSGERKGYSGVATFTRQEPLMVQHGIGIERFDAEGRVLVTEHDRFVLINAYFPNGRRDLGRVDFKLEFCDALLKLCTRLRRRGKRVIVCGDFNTAHREIDLTHPRANAEASGFLPVERAWIDTFIRHGYVDIFRTFQQGPEHYTWWSWQYDARANNVGWRIDYHFVSEDLVPEVKRASLLPHVVGSDHCPVLLELHNGRRKSRG
jgi:exodeoxyribonuclease-3